MSGNGTKSYVPPDFAMASSRNVDMNVPWWASRQVGGSVNSPSPARLKCVWSAPSTPPATAESAMTVPNDWNAQRISGDVHLTRPATQSS